jgi:hypothetical protein
MLVSYSISTSTDPRFGNIVSPKETTRKRGRDHPCKHYAKCAIVGIAREIKHQSSYRPERTNVEHSAARGNLVEAVVATKRGFNELSTRKRKRWGARSPVRR